MGEAKLLMKEKIEKLRQDAAEAIKEKVANLTDLNDIRVKYLGKKGELTAILRGMSQLGAEDRPKIGKIVNEARAQLEALITEKNEQLKARELADKLSSERIDVTLPGRQFRVGHLHPLTLTMGRIKDIFLNMGFSK